MFRILNRLERLALSGDSGLGDSVEGESRSCRHSIANYTLSHLRRFGFDAGVI